jgi:hypothetical protein
MITDAGPLAGFVKAATVALSVWFGGLVVIAPLLEPTRDVLVVGPLSTVAALTSIGASLVDSSAGLTRVRGGEPGFVMRLYAHGAWIVFPAFEGGCNRPLRPKAASRG